MNILHISPYYPDIEANHAGGVCMGKEIETLALFNNVYVLTFISQPFDEKLAAKHKGDEKWQHVRISKLSRAFHVLTMPWIPNYFAARSSLRFAIKLIKMVRKNKIDAIHAEYASMGQYLWITKLFPKLEFNLVEHDMTAQSFERKVQDAKNVHDTKNAIMGGADLAKAERSSNKNADGSSNRLKALLKLKYLSDQFENIKRHEKKYCLSADKLFTFNEKDKRLIEEFYGRKDTVVLNTYCGIEDSVFEEAHRDIIEKEPDSICFLGQMGRPENDRAGKRLIDICAVVKQSIPDLKVYLVGNKPSQELINKAEKENNNAANKKWITVTGFVDDVDIYLKKSKAAVFPLDMGAGIKVKVLRSMALGTPVITGQVGAEGIDEDGNVIALAETDREFADRIIELLSMNDTKLEELGQRSREYIKEHFSWKKSEEILREVYRL